MQLHGHRDELDGRLTLVGMGTHAHARACALQCAKGGYGAVVDGKFVKFDAKGNDLAKEALTKSDKKDHLRATIDGELKDGVIQVSSLKLE